jgi:hypothetical protein
MKQASTEKHSLKVHVLVQKHLEFDEEIIHLVKQNQSLFTIWPEYIVATTNRLFFCVPTGFGPKLNVTNYPLEYIENIKFKAKFLGSVLQVNFPKNVLIKTEYLPVKSTKELYDFIVEKTAKKA